MIIFSVVAIISVVAQFFVSVNYKMVDYLPKDSQSTVALDIMKEEFSGGVPDTNVMLYDVTIQEALDFKEQLASIDGVKDITWLDDAMDLKTPIEYADQAMVETYYKNSHALFSFAIESGEEVRVTDEIYQLIGTENAMAGEALDTATQQKMAFQETMFASALLIPIIVIILVLSTSSWSEPLFFLTAIGISVLINMGTNIFLGEVSFVTQSVAPILQLAVSLDYAIFLLHSFEDYRHQVDSPTKAMKLAMKRSFPAIIASAATTFFGFIALAFMKFEIGSDLGINLVKGIVLSFLSVMVFLPAFTLVFYKWIDKTHHKPFIPKISGFGKYVSKLKIPSLVIVAILLIPAFIAQDKNDFIYGVGEQPETTRAGMDIKKIEDEFGASTTIVLLVPKQEGVAIEEHLVEELNEIEEVTSTISYVNAVGAGIPVEYLEEDVTEQFYSENYSRIIVQLNTPQEGDEAFKVVEDIQQLSQSFYDEKVYSLGESVTLFDIKQVVERDSSIVNILTVGTIALVLLFTFRSLSFPVVLLLTIQASVWINLSIPYFTNEPLVYVGYLIVSTVQLAATVDYAILLTETYTMKRKEMGAIEAVKQTLDEKTFSIAISASIMSSVGFILWITSSNPIVSSIGLLLGRGAFLAFILVLFFLPAILIMFDKLIDKTTLKAKFYK